MTRTDAFIQDLSDARDKAHVGGKADNLGRLIRAGFPVPGGFVVTTHGYRHARAATERGETELPPELIEQIRAAYAHMGGGRVAVRSSATAEDSSAASMAGQYETFLHVGNEVELLDAIKCCWASLDSPRTRAYLGEKGIDPAGVAMAVVVQRLVAADVAGVLFTANPQTGVRREMLVEASWGLGEAVVSGLVQPDVLRLETATGRVLEAVISDKRVQVSPGEHGEKPVAEEMRKARCLRSTDVTRLWEIGRKAADYFGSPQDLEWAIHNGELYLLQSRPITTLADAERQEEVLRDTRAALREKIAAGQGPWVLHNLAETLPHPTPLTWGVIRKFMSGVGGYGKMYRDVGFAPSPAVCRDGFLDCIAGRVYMDTSRAAGMFFDGFPFRYDLDRLRNDPDAGQAPPTIPCGSLKERFRIGRRLAEVNLTLRRMAATFDRELSETIVPKFVEWVDGEKQRDLSALSVEQLLDVWHERQVKVLDEFAPQSLLPSLIGGMALADLRQFISEALWDEDADAVSQFLSAGAPPDMTAKSDALLYQVAQGNRPVEDWLKAYGHRAAGEFDLASPRWREVPDAVKTLAARLAGGVDPAERQRDHAETFRRKLTELKNKLQLYETRELEALLDLLWRYLPYREDGKYYLMLGYGLLRDVALEAGRRLEIGEDVFYLTPEDLADSLRVGFAPHQLIQQRKATHQAEEKIFVPRLIDAGSIDSLGEPPKVEIAGSYKAFALSSGDATGPARIVRSPAEAGDLGRGYVLVCPSTDPSWTPLFVNAAGLVLECGGTLSHGAVVAREMGLPAVVLPEATRIFADGEIVRVDGRNGAVGRAAEVTTDAKSPDANGRAAEIATTAKADPNDTNIPRELIPPPPGAKERWSAKVRNIALLVWGVILLAAFLLPEKWVYRPIFWSMDKTLWPVVRDLGRPATVAIVAIALAVATMVLQWLFTDNARLREAKRRAALLNREANKFPPASPRARAMQALAAPIQWRVAAASFVPLALLLGPMTLPFLWFPERVDPEQRPADPGATITVVAMVDAKVKQVALSVPAEIEFDSTKAATQELPAIENTLKAYLAKLKATRSVPDELPWSVRLAAEREAETTIADLDAFLKAGIPPQPVTWILHPPKDKTGGARAKITADNGVPTTIYLAIGESEPRPRTAFDGVGTVKSVNVTYAKSDKKVHYWPLLERFIDPRWGIGWLILATYLLAYLPALFLVKRVLRIA